MLAIWRHTGAEREGGNYEPLLRRFRDGEAAAQSQRAGDGKVRVRAHGDRGWSGPRKKKTGSPELGHFFFISLFPLPR